VSPTAINEQNGLVETQIATRKWQRNRTRSGERFREASRSRASDSPTLGEDRSPNSPARRRIFEAGEIEERILKQWMDPAVTKPEDRALFNLDS
jgi:hypothetical protein